MKRICILSGLLLALTSCVHENGTGGDIHSPGTIAFIAREPNTKAPGTNAPDIISFPGENGYHLVMTTQQMGSAYSPATRGTPAYTSNMGDLYGSFEADFYKPGTTTPFLYNVAFGYDQAADNWKSDFVEDPWETSDPFYISMLMPGRPTGLSSFATSFPSNTPTITFSYTCPDKAEDQQDILVSGRSLSKSQYESSRSSGGAPVLFQHALTAVKFAIGNNDENNYNRQGRVETYISEIVISGMRYSGTCTIHPDNEGDYTDKKNNYSSATAVSWDTSSATRDFHQNFSESDITDFNSSGPFADTFYAAATDRNLNDEDASLTFWLIPQDITSAVTLTVTFHVWDGTQSHEDMTLSLPLGEILLAQESQKNVHWLAGEMRTFTLHPDGVDVISSDAVANGIKNNYEIKNIGNINEYVRCLITGNWVDASGNVVVGYTSATDDTFASPWSPSNATYGTFSNLALAARGWTKNGDYYYYNTALEPGQSVPADKRLFDTYTVGTAPTVWTTNPDNTTERISTDVHLQMHIAVQAIEAPQNIGYQAAWTSAAGVNWNN